MRLDNTKSPYLYCLTCDRASYNDYDITNLFCPSCGYLEDNLQPWAIMERVPKHLKHIFKAWCITKNPNDFPQGYYVARLFFSSRRGPIATSNYIASQDLQIIRQILTNNQLHRINRFNNDDPVILETWM